LNGQVGDTSSLSTSAKNLTGGINELASGVNKSASDINNAFGDISNLYSIKEDKVVSYKNADGSSWYRKYSDGRLEQGGCLILSASYNSSAIDDIITFLIPFVGDTNSIRVTANGVPTDRSSWNNNISSGICYALDLTKCRIIFSNLSPGFQANVWWEAEGWWK
jgi:hypothetical protein